jgi:hypothetical protein
MQYRCSKDLNDRDGNLLIRWDVTIQASSDGDGWIKCELQAATEDATKPTMKEAKDSGVVMERPTNELTGKEEIKVKSIVPDAMAWAAATASVVRKASASSKPVDKRSRNNETAGNDIAMDSQQGKKTKTSKKSDDAKPGTITQGDNQKEECDKTAKRKNKKHKNKKTDGTATEETLDKGRKKAKTKRWEVRSVALQETSTLSLPLPLADMAKANAALIGDSIKFGDSSSSSSRAPSPRASDSENEEEGNEAEDSDAASETTSSSSLSASSMSSGAMAVAKEMSEGTPAASFSWERPIPLMAANEFSMQPTRVPQNAMQALLGTGASNQQVETFIMACRVDGDAAARLRALPPLIQTKVMQQGLVCDADNPSSVLLARVREAEMGGAPQGYGGGTGITPSMLMPCNDREVEAVINKYQLDIRASGLIRALPPNERKKVLAIPFEHSKNPSMLVVQQLAGGGKLLRTRRSVVRTPLL